MYGFHYHKPDACKCAAAEHAQERHHDQMREQANQILISQGMDAANAQNRVKELDIYQLQGVLLGLSIDKVTGLAHYQIEALHVLKDKGLTKEQAQRIHSESERDMLIKSVNEDNIDFESAIRIISSARYNRSGGFI